MTLKEAVAIGKANGFTIRHNHHDREYRVNLIGGNEDSAYYTNDRDDAVQTGIYMRQFQTIKTIEAEVDVTIKAFEHADDCGNLNAMKFCRTQLARDLSPIAQLTPFDYDSDSHCHPAEKLYAKVSQALSDMATIINSESQKVGR